MDDALRRRASLRFPVSLSATLTLAGVAHTCAVSNLSMGGALVSTVGVAVAMGHQVRLCFVLPVLREEINTPATVRWLAEDGIGLQFDGLRAREVWALGKYLEQLREPTSYVRA